jgi:hypothetical protein
MPNYVDNGATHPSISLPIASGVEPGEGLAEANDAFNLMVQRTWQILQAQGMPETNSTLAGHIKDLNGYVTGVVLLHLRQYGGWNARIFPLELAKAGFWRMQVWERMAQPLDPTPEGVAPRILAHTKRNYTFMLMRHSIGTEAEHQAFLTEEGLFNWLNDQMYYGTATNNAREILAATAVNAHPTTITRAMAAQGQRLFGSVQEALEFEISTFLCGFRPHGLATLVATANQMISVASPDQLPFDTLVLPSGAAQRIGASRFETDPLRRGDKAIVHGERGGATWISDANMGVEIYETSPLQGIRNLGTDPLSRLTTFSTAFLVDGLTPLLNHPDAFSPHRDLSVRVRSYPASPGLETYSYDRALRDCHRFGEDGYIDVRAHEAVARGVVAALEALGEGAPIERAWDADPFLWHPPTHVDRAKPDFHVCKLYGDVSSEFRPREVDDAHAAAFAREAAKVLGDSGLGALAELRHVLQRLSRPNAATWHDIAPWLAAVAEGADVSDGCYAVPARAGGHPDLPYGFTTFAGVKALADARDLAPADWSAEAREMFRKAASAWPHLQALWAFVKRAYPECLLVKRGSDYVAPWMRSDYDDLNAFYATFSNFFDVAVRYPAWIVGDAAAARPLELSPVALGLPDGDEELKAALREIDPSVRDYLRDAESAAEFLKTYAEQIGPNYAGRVAVGGRAGTEFKDFVALEVAPLASAAERAAVMTGITTFVWNVASDSGVQSLSLTRAEISGWIRDAGRAPARRPVLEAGNQKSTRLCFHHSVWKYANQPERVRPTDPEMYDYAMAEESRAEFARGMMRGGDRDEDDEGAAGGSVFRGRPADPGERLRLPRQSEARARPMSALDAADDQALYPNLLSKHQMLLWRQSADGDVVQNHYMARRVEDVGLRARTPLAKLGAMCLFFSRVSMQADLACVSCGLPPPDLCFVCVRHSARLRTQSAIVARGGGIAGHMYYKWPNNMIGVNAITKVWTSHYEIHLAAAIEDPRYVMHHPNVFAAGDMSGYDLVPVSRKFDMQHPKPDESLMVIYAGSNWSRERALRDSNPFPLGGSYDPRFFGGARFEERVRLSPGTIPVPGWLFQNYLHNLSRINVRTVNKWDATSADSERNTCSRGYNPGIVFQERQYPGGDKPPKSPLFVGSGHTRSWPDDVRGLVGGRVFSPVELACS